MPARDIEDVARELDELKKWKKDLQKWQSSIDKAIEESKTDRGAIRGMVRGLTEDFRLLGVYVKDSIGRMEVQAIETHKLMVEIHMQIGGALVITEEAKLPCKGCPRITDWVERGKIEVDAALAAARVRDLQCSDDNDKETR